MLRKIQTSQAKLLLTPEAMRDSPGAVHHFAVAVLTTSFKSVGTGSHSRV